MRKNNKYSLDIKGELSKRDSSMVAKIYAYAALIAAIGFAVAAVVSSISLM